ncbi:hypothetical protein B0H19DRAFT_1258833 [Mycena capillaripes]|nr:hypothetical protein B0H19DRAFT_1258833 [Mycena capillaripes]
MNGILFKNLLSGAPPMPHLQLNSWNVWQAQQIFGIPAVGRTVKHLDLIDPPIPVAPVLGICDPTEPAWDVPTLFQIHITDMHCQLFFQYYPAGDAGMRATALAQFRVAIGVAQVRFSRAERDRAFLEYLASARLVALNVTNPGIAVIAFSHFW